MLYSAATDPSLRCCLNLTSKTKNNKTSRFAIARFMRRRAAHTRWTQLHFKMQKLLNTTFNHENNHKLSN